MTAFFPTPFLPGPRLIDGNDLNKMFILDLASAEDAITAHAGGGQAAAYQLTAARNRVSVCATTNDSVALPPASIGASVTIRNDGAQSLQVFTKLGDLSTINGTAGATGVAVAAASTLTLCCYSVTGAVGAWNPD